MMMHSVGKTVEIRQGDDETNAPSPARAPEDKKKIKRLQEITLITQSTG
jgi:hypothetical protein